MLKAFSATPLFDAHSHFYQMDRDEFFPNDTPSVRKYVEATNNLVPGAMEDYQHVKGFLWSKCRKSEATYNAFRSESERFLLWAWTVKERSIAFLKKRDIEDYIDFVVKPPKSWIGLQIKRRFTLKNGVKVPTKEWRPFVVRLSKAERKEYENNNSGKTLKLEKKNYSLQHKSIVEVFSNLSVLYNFLVEDEYAFGNPIQAVKKSSPYLVVDVTNEGVKRLSSLQWEYVLEATKARANSEPVWERHLFIIACMKSLYLRMSELSYRKNWTPTMGDFYSDSDGNWWFTAFGKGNKKRKVSVPEDFLVYLLRYRASRGLEGLPTIDESATLLQPIRQKSPGLQARAISQAAQAAFDSASAKLAEDGFKKDSKILLATSTHWLRHTGASMDVENRPLKDLSADLGHDQISTTDKAYVHADDQERAASGKGRTV